MLASAAATAQTRTEAVPPSGGAVSVSLCADAYLLELADPDAIAALSWQVDQPVSSAPGWARERPLAWASAERLLVLSPDLTVFGAGEGGRAARLLDRAGLAHTELEWVSDFEGVRQNLLRLGADLDRGDAAQAAVARLDSRLATLASRTEGRGSRPQVVYLSASGGSSGGGTFVDAAITAAGGRNVLAEAGIQGWTRADPELALTVEADLVVTSFFERGFASADNHALHHAAYRRLLGSLPRVEIPAGDWPCAGPRLIEAAEAIADAIDYLEAGR